jgi:hypothetical protein
LVLLGRAWSRLLIYPGGLAAFGLIWLIDLLQKRAPSAGSWIVEEFDDPRPLILSSVALPWLALALLPLPLAVALPRQIDIVLALALLEWPNVLAIRQELRLGGLRRLAAALNSYPALLLATLALAQAGNSLELAALARPPGDSAAIGTRALHWLGAIALALALPPALRIGAFGDDGRPTDDRRPVFAAGALLIGLRLRAIGLVALAALPWAGAEGTSVALLRMLGAAALIAALLAGYDRLTRRQAARRWAWAYLALDLALLLALLVAAYLALQARLA